MTEGSKPTAVADRPSGGSHETVKDKAKLLLVDDEPKNLRLLEALLLPVGYELLMAESGEQCLQVIAENEVDLVLLDVMMPGMDGYEVTRRLRSGEDTRLIPVVIISALREARDRVDGIQAGCDDFISKPFDKNEVLAKVQTTLRLSYYRRQLDEKEQFEALVYRISEGIVVCDTDWTIRRINTRGEQCLHGATPGANLLDLLFDLYTVSLSRVDLEASLSESNKRFSLARSQSKKSGPTYLHASMDILKDPEGNVTSMILSLRDMTGERRKEKLKEDFLNIVSHKLRGPVGAISRGLSRFGEGAIGTLSDDQARLVSSMAAEATTLSGLVEKLVRFSIVNSGSIINKQASTLPREEIALKTYLPRLLKSTPPGPGGKKVNLDLYVKDDTAKVRASSVYFDAIILNLVDNAIKFCDKDVVIIDVVVDKTDKEVLISIRDNGPGIPHEETSKVFEAFYQAAADSGAEGAGLGLPMVKRLVTAYGGEVRLESAAGNGATFTVTLPSS